MYCGEQCIVKPGREATLAVTLRCRSWTCDTCAPLRRRRLIAEAIAGRPDTFVTMTTRRRDGIRPADAAAELAAAWRNLAKRALRAHRKQVTITSQRERPRGAAGYTDQQGNWTRRAVRLRDDKLHYLAVIEKHQSGWPHLHLLLRSEWIDQEWLQREWRDLTGSHHVRIERARSRKRTASYCAKYVGKNPHRFGTTKRYWSTRRWRCDAKPPQHDLSQFEYPWDRSGMHIETWALNYVRLGWSITWSGTDRAVARAPPERRLEARAYP